MTKHKKLFKGIVISCSILFGLSMANLTLANPTEVGSADGYPTIKLHSYFHQHTVSVDYFKKGHNKAADRALDKKANGYCNSITNLHKYNVRVDHSNTINGPGEQGDGVVTETIEMQRK